jgi:hypothetical protein
MSLAARAHGQAGMFVTGVIVNAAAIVGTAPVLLLNVILIIQTFRALHPGQLAAD